MTKLSVTISYQSDTGGSWQLSICRISLFFKDEARTSCWRVESSGYYKDKPCLCADFSDDGTMLAVGFGNALTLWDPIENHMCTAITQSGNVTKVKFCIGGHLALSTETEVVLWDLCQYVGK